MKEISDIFKVRDAARYLKVHEETVRSMARRGELPSFKVGREWRFRKDALDAWSKAQNPIASKAHILAVDDEAPFLRLVRHILEQQGHRVSTEASGERALDIVRRDPPDLVFLDLNMPGMNGPTTLKEIRRLDASMPVIIVTGYPEGNLMIEALKYGPLIVLAKPIEEESFLLAVRTVLKDYRNQEVKP